MAITSVTISQANITDLVDLLSVHNPIVFIADVAYTGEAPDVLNVGIYDETGLMDTFAAIPYQDITGARQFVFIADDLLRSYMGEIDDFKSSEKVLEYVEGITKEFTIRFYDPETPATYDEVSFVAMHAARQFGDDPCLESIYTNVDETYYGAEGMPVYVYFYNASESNVLSIGSGEVSLQPLVDYDDVLLYDFDDQKLLAL